MALGFRVEGFCFTIFWVLHTTASLNFCPTCNMTYMQTATFPLPLAKRVIHKASIITVNKETYLFAGPCPKDYIYLYVYIGVPLFWETDASKPAETCKTQPPELRWAGFRVYLG